MLKPESTYERGTHELVDSTLGWRFVNPRLDAAQEGRCRWAPAPRATTFEPGRPASRPAR
jgi:hypothetical protein